MKEQGFKIYLWARSSAVIFWYHIIAFNTDLLSSLLQGLATALLAEIIILSYEWRRFLDSSVPLCVSISSNLTGSEGCPFTLV